MLHVLQVMRHAVSRLGGFLSVRFRLIGSEPDARLRVVQAECWTGLHVQYVVDQHVRAEPFM
jgi:hypothetical protein